MKTISQRIKEYKDSFIKEQQSFSTYPLQQKINELKRKLSATDYKAIKYAEGLITPEEYETTKLLRSGWRAEINLLELQIEALKKT